MHKDHYENVMCVVRGTKVRSINLITCPERSNLLLRGIIGTTAVSSIHTQQHTSVSTRQSFVLLPPSDAPFLYENTVRKAALGSRVQWQLMLRT